MSLAPYDYAVLLSRLEGPRDCAWPLIMRDSLAVEDALVDDDSDDAIAARAAWWSRLTAPRREAEADDAADDQLALSLFEPGRDNVCGWYRIVVSENERVWDRLGPDGEWAYENLTTRQLRARLAFAGATGVKCEACDCGYVEVSRCPKCDTAYLTLPEPVPQRDASHGARCGCVRERLCMACGGDGRAAADTRESWPCLSCGGSYEPKRLGTGRVVRPDSNCRFCSQSPGIVRDGRRDDAGAREYAPGRGAHWTYTTTHAAVPWTQWRRVRVEQELRHRREQPDACGHPAELKLPTDAALVVIKMAMDYANGPMAIRRLCARMSDRSTHGLARAPLAETLHGEREGALDWGEPVSSDVLLAANARRSVDAAVVRILGGASRREGP